MSDQRQDWAELRARADFPVSGGYSTVKADQLAALLAEVDRLTEALEAARPCGCGSMSRDAASDFKAVAAEAVEMRLRAERAEADLADEKRRHTVTVGLYRSAEADLTRIRDGLAEALTRADEGRKFVPKATLRVLLMDESDRALLSDGATGEPT